MLKNSIVKLRSKSLFVRIKKILVSIKNEFYFNQLVVVKKCRMRYLAQT